jgi:flavin-binding protein dodecin
MPTITVQKLTGNSPDSATTAAVGSAIRGLAKFDWIIIDAEIIGSTNGTVDATIQRKISALADGTAVDVWVDWVRFPQVAAGATKHYHLSLQSSAAITEVDWDTEAAPAAATIAANTTLGGHPGDAVRLVVTAGAGTDSAAAQTIYFSGWQTR